LKKKAKELLTEDALNDLLDFLELNPDKSDFISGTG
jgi:hypothetical protein